MQTQTQHCTGDFGSTGAGGTVPPVKAPAAGAPNPGTGQELRREGSLTCRDCSDATCKGFVVGSGLAVENARSIL